MIDDALGSLGADLPGGVGIAAVGGYGRGELCPGSDIDLLVLHDGASTATLETVVRTVVYPLWDAGLTVGHAVRSLDEAVAEAATVQTATATLDARAVAGDRVLVRRARGAVTADLRSRRWQFLGELRELDRRRRVEAGSGRLEPDLKRSPGGLRDVHVLRWVAIVLVGQAGLDPLVSAGYVGAADRSRLARAHDRLLAMRVALHLHSGRGADRLAAATHEPVATRLGYVDGDGPGDTAAHRLLADQLLAARTIEHVHRRAWRLVEADRTRGRRRRSRGGSPLPDGLQLVDGTVRVPDGRSLGDPVLPVALLEALADAGATLHPRTAGRLRRHVDDGGGWEWTAAGRRRFLRALWRGPRTLPAVLELDEVGVITAMLPEWRPVRGRPQRNPFHRFSVDRHGWEAAARLAALAADEPWAERTLAAVDDHDALILGAWLHDVGKAHGEPHTRTGVPVARAIARRMGATPGTVARVGRLVRLHLLLPHVAARRDLSDPGEIARVADEVGDASTLRALHLLAAADGRATGPAAWSRWKASLVRTLVERVAARLDGDPVRRPPRPGGAAPAPDESPPVVRVGSSRVDGALLRRLRVVLAHRPGLLAAVTGVLALNDLDVVAASARTRPGTGSDDAPGADVAEVRLTVRVPDGDGVVDWTAIREALLEAARDDTGLAERLARRRELDQRRRAPTAAVPTRVSVGPDGRGAASVLDVTTADRRGVLHDVLRVIAARDLRVHLAKIETRGHLVRDAFYVRSADGGPLSPEQADGLVRAVRAALRGAPALGAGDER